MRILHTMLRVVDLDKSIDFYVNKLGMNLIRRKDYPHGKFTLAFVGYGSEKENAVIANNRVQLLKVPRFSVTEREWMSAVAASQGIKEAFSTGSQNHQPPQPSS